jgi:hypothetical protein
MNGVAFKALAVQVLLIALCGSLSVGILDGFVQLLDNAFIVRFS